MAKNQNYKAPEKPKEAPEATQAVTLPPEALPPVSVQVSHNSSLLEWPTDVWGLTKDLKKVLTALASRINGQPDKKVLAEKTLAIGLAHIEAKYEADNRIRTKKLAKATAEAEAAETVEQPTLF